MVTTKSCLNMEMIVDFLTKSMGMLIEWTIAFFCQDPSIINSIKFGKIVG